MIANRPDDMRQAFVISIALHVAFLLAIILAVFIRPFSPQEFTFDKVEVIDSETFDALVEQAQSGNYGEEESDALAQSQAAEAAETAPQAEEQTDASTATQEPLSTAPAVQPDNLPEPIFNPSDSTSDQPLPEVEQTPSSGIAAPQSEGRENAEAVTTIPTPPARDAAQLRQIAQEATADPVNTPEEEVATQTAEDAQQSAEDRTQAEIDATSSLEPEAEQDVPLTAAPEVAIVPQSRPNNLAVPNEVTTNEPETQEPVISQDEQTASVDAGAGEDAQATQTQAVPEPETQAAETASDGVANNDEQDQGDDVSIDDLLASVVGNDNGSENAGGRPLNESEIRAGTQQIVNNWVITPLIDKQNRGDLVITVRFKTDSGGNLVGDVYMITPQNPSQDQLIVLDTVRRAVMRTLPLQMPPDISPDGNVWTITFDPASQNVDN